MGYFSILFYYEKEDAIKNFFKYAETEQIIIEDNVEKTDFHTQLIFLLNEIEKRPGLYTSKWDVKNVKAFLEGCFAGEDLNTGAEIGTSMERFDYEFGKYVSDKYELYEDVEWYYKLEYISIGFKNYIEVFAECLNEFISIVQDDG